MSMFLIYFGSGRDRMVFTEAYDPKRQANLLEFWPDPDFLMRARRIATPTELMTWRAATGRLPRGGVVVAHDKQLLLVQETLGLVHRQCIKECPVGQTILALEAQLY